MTFIDPLELRTAPEEIRTVLEHDRDLSLLGVMAHARGTFMPWLDFGTALLSKLELSPLLRELAILQVAVLHHGGEYEWAQHAPLARAAGATEAQLEALRRGIFPATEFSAEQALVVRFTSEVVRDGYPSRKARAALLELLGAQQVVELLEVIGQYMMVARIVATAGLEPEPPAAVVAATAREAPRADEVAR